MAMAAQSRQPSGAVKPRLAKDRPLASQSAAPNATRVHWLPIVHAKSQVRAHAGSAWARRRWAGQKMPWSISGAAMANRAM